jgi:CHASE3 domain sensor protein
VEQDVFQNLISMLPWNSCVENQLRINQKVISSVSFIHLIFLVMTSVIITRKSKMENSTLKNHLTKSAARRTTHGDLV